MKNDIDSIKARVGDDFIKRNHTDNLDLIERIKLRRSCFYREFLGEQYSYLDEINFELMLNSSATLSKMLVFFSKSLGVAENEVTNSLLMKEFGEDVLVRLNEFCHLFEEGIDFDGDNKFKLFTCLKSIREKGFPVSLNCVLKVYEKYVFFAEEWTRKYGEDYESPFINCESLILTDDDNQNFFLGGRNGFTFIEQLKLFLKISKRRMNKAWGERQEFFLAYDPMVNVHFPDVMLFLVEGAVDDLEQKKESVFLLKNILDSLKGFGLNCFESRTCSALKYALDYVLDSEFSLSPSNEKDLDVVKFLLSVLVKVDIENPYYFCFSNLKEVNTDVLKNVESYME